MTASLVLPEVSSEDRFDFVTQMWAKLTGGVLPGYSNETFLSEIHTADRNRCLGYLMKEKGAFPARVSSPAALEEVLEFYIQMCSLELDCEGLSVVAATLANGGVNPLTSERVFRAETVRNVLSLMSSSGMYDYSGRFQVRIHLQDTFLSPTRLTGSAVHSLILSVNNELTVPQSQWQIGVPAKSGVSGALLIVVPNVFGIATFAPRLDALGNSVRGIDFARLLEEEYTVHRYSLLRGVSKKHDLQDFTRDIYLQRRCQRLMEAATRGDLRALKLCISEGMSIDCSDYDLRSPAHLAASEGHLPFLQMLHDAGADLSTVDRWGATPLDDAKKTGHAHIDSFLRSVKAKSNSARK